MNSFQNILQEKITQVKAETPKMDEKTIHFLFEKVVGDYYGSKGKSNVLPVHFKGGVLTLAVYKSLWQAEITLSKEDLREALNTKIGSELVKDIRIQRK